MEEPIFIAVCQKCKRELDIEQFDYDLEYCADCQLENRLSQCQLETTERKILSIDIGVLHLGMTLSVIGDDDKFKEVVWMDLIDITANHCLPNCSLYHSKTVCDRMSHVLRKYEDIFRQADVVLIEQQPPQGLVAVEQIIFSYCRDKATLISPSSVHKYFFMRDLDYEARKDASVRIASRYLSETFLQKLEKYDRKHDICDSILFMLYWVKKFGEYVERERLVQKRKEAMEKYNMGLGMSLNDFFDQFRYIPPPPKM